MLFLRHHVLRSPEGEESSGGSSVEGGDASETSVETKTESSAEVKTETKVEPSWRDDWRQAMSKGDEKALKQLQRYASPEAIWDKARSLEARMSSGELRPMLKKDASAAELAEWRTAHGIPDKPEGYDIGPVEKMGERNKALLDKFLPLAHAANMTPAQVKATMKFVGDRFNDEAATRKETDDQLIKSGEDSLRSEWGADYRRNIGIIQNTLDSVLDPEFKENLLGGRLADGTPIGSSLPAMKFWLELGLVKNPAATLVPNAGANPMKGIEDRKAEIEKMMREDRPAYNKNEKVQQEYLDLLRAEEKLKARA